jgi:hypothetical protein
MAKPETLSLSELMAKAKAWGSLRGSTASFEEKSKANADYIAAVSPEVVIAMAEALMAVWDSKMGDPISQEVLRTKYGLEP